MRAPATGPLRCVLPVSVDGPDGRSCAYTSLLPVVEGLPGTMKGARIVPLASQRLLSFFGRRYPAIETTKQPRDAVMAGRYAGTGVGTRRADCVVSRRSVQDVCVHTVLHWTARALRECCENGNSRLSSNPAGMSGLRKACAAVGKKVPVPGDTCGNRGMADVRREMRLSRWCCSSRTSGFITLPPLPRRARCRSDSLHLSGRPTCGNRRCPARRTNRRAGTALFRPRCFRRRCVPLE